MPATSSSAAGSTSPGRRRRSTTSSTATTPRRSVTGSSTAEQPMPAWGTEAAARSISSRFPTSSTTWRRSRSTSRRRWQDRPVGGPPGSAQPGRCRRRPGHRRPGAAARRHRGCARSGAGGTRSLHPSAELVEGGGEGVDADGDGLSDTAETELVQIVEDTRAALIPDGLVVETLDPESLSRSRERPTRDRRRDGGFARATGGERSGAAAAGRGRRYRPRRGGGRRRSRRRRPLRRVGTFLAALPSSTTARADRASRHPARSAEPQTDGSQPDIVVARQAVSALQSLATSLGVSASNQERLVEQAQQGLDFLLNADRESLGGRHRRRGRGDVQGDVDQASRAVGL